MNILCDVVVGAGAGQYYGTLLVSNFRYTDGSPVKVSQYLSINFKAPAAINDPDIYQDFVQWVGVTVEASSNGIDAGTFEVAAKASFDAAHTMDPRDRFTISVNGDLTQHADVWLKSFIVTADQAAAVDGTVTVSCPACPDPALLSVRPKVDFVLGSQTVTLRLDYGKSTSVKLPRGDYAIVSHPLESGELTVVVPLHISPASISVAPGQALALSAGFGPIERYAALNITVYTLDGLATETLHISVLDKASQRVLGRFESGINHSTSLYKLPPSGSVQIQVSAIHLNDIEYLFSVPALTLANKAQEVAIANSVVKASKVSTNGFVNLPVTISADKASSKVLNVRLTSASMSYVLQLAASNQRASFPTLIKPDTYTVEVSNFIENGVVHAVSAPASFVVAGNGSSLLALSVTTAADLHVRGFPSHLSFGGCADLTPGNVADFVDARVDFHFYLCGCRWHGVMPLCSWMTTRKHGPLLIWRAR